MASEFANKLRDGLKKLHDTSAAEMNSATFLGVAEQFEKDWWDYRRAYGDMCDVVGAFDQVNFTTPNGIIPTFHRYLLEFEKELPKGDISRPIIKAFVPLCRVAVSAVDDCAPLCTAVETTGMGVPMLRCLDSKELLTARDNENIDQGYGVYALNCCIFYANVMYRVPDVADPLIQNGGPAILSKYSSCKSKILALRALIAQGYLVTDPKGNELPINDDMLNFIKDTVDRKLKRISSGVGDFTLYGLLVYLHQLIRCSEPCGKGLLRLGFLDVMAKIMEAPPGSTSEASTPGEKRSCAKICWVLALHEGSGTENSKLMKAHPRLKTALESIKPIRDDLAKAAEGALWQIQKRCERAPSARPRTANSGAATAAPAPAAAPAQPAAGKQHQVMISYTTSHKPKLVTRINEELTKLGVKTWIFKTEMKGDMFDEMAQAIEDSAAVLVCYSNAYFNSEPCHAELNYARELKRTLIPVRLEKFTPRGWLGISISGKLYYDFSTADTDESAFQASLAKLHECIKSEFAKM